MKPGDTVRFVGTLAEHINGEGHPVTVVRLLSGDRVQVSYGDVRVTVPAKYVEVVE